MGKNKNKKTKTVNSSSSEKKKPKGLCCKKRNELNEILKKIMRLTSEIIPDGKVNWEAHLEIDKLLQKVQEIEPCKYNFFLNFYIIKMCLVNFFILLITKYYYLLFLKISLSKLKTKINHY